jgi:prepilin peptidase CpaA
MSHANREMPTTRGPGSVSIFGPSNANSDELPKRKAMLELSTLPESLARIFAHSRELVLAAFLVAGAWIDWRTFRIPNWLTLSGLAAGLAYNASPAPGALGFLTALGGAAIGLAALLPLYAGRVMGAGDVKLMALVGAFLGTSQVLFAVLFTFIAGGIAALAFALWTQSTGRLALNVSELVRGGPGIASVGRLPYGISICAGTLAWLALTLR